MLTKTDTKQIRDIVEEELDQSIDTKIKPLIKQELTSALNNALKPIKKQLNQLSKDISYIIKNFDERLTSLERVVKN